MIILQSMNALKCRTLGAMRARILKSARATEMCVTRSIQNICWQKTETKEKEACCLTLNCIPGSVQPTVSLFALESSVVEKLRRIPLQYRCR